MGITGEHHLFILWEAARVEEKRILDDIAENFEIVRIIEIRWSEKVFAENLTRFYGLLLPPGSHKEVHVGTGPFLAVIVKDHQPRYRVEETSRGPEKVNVNLFRAKTRHREWTGGGHKIHATNTTREFDHDLVLLLGRNAQDFENGVFPEFALDDGGSHLFGDLAGAGGWESLRHMFYVLNSTIEYVVLRNFDALPDSYYAGSHGDIDLLVGNLDEAVFVTGATRVFPQKYRVHVKIKVGGDDVLFDLRFVGDGYYDRAWQARMLESTETTGGVVRILPPDDHFHGLLYHALIHKKAIAPDYVSAFTRLAPQVIVKSDGHLDVAAASTLLGRWLASKGYQISVPERSVQFNVRNALRTQAHISRIRPAIWPWSYLARPFSISGRRSLREMSRSFVGAARKLAGRSLRLILGEDRWARIRARLRGGGA